jgi:hypothetical protein
MVVVRCMNNTSTVKKTTILELKTGLGSLVMFSVFEIYGSLSHLTPWSRILLEKLLGAELVKTFPTFYGTKKLISIYTRGPL